MILATYPFRLGKELSGHLFFRKDGKRNLRGLALSGVCRVPFCGIPFGTNVITDTAVRSYIKHA